MSDRLEIYETRTMRATHALSDVHFGVLNRVGATALDNMGGYCLNAPEQMPAGSVRCYGKAEFLVKPSLSARSPHDEVMTQERQALASRLIARLLVEQGVFS